MKRLLLIGASGFLGWNVCEFLQDDWEIIGLYHDHPDGIPDYINRYKVNLREDFAFEHILEKTQADAVMHLAAISSPKYCEDNPSDSYQLNVGVPKVIAQLCKDFALPLVFASSEQVYDGSQASNSEEDELAPINEYGRQKLTAEQKILKLYPPACIVRLAVMYGTSNAAAPSFMQQMLDAWEKGEEVTVFHDEVRSFLSGYSAAEGLFSLLNRQASGVFNMGGKGAISRLDFANHLAKAFGVKKPKIKSISQKDIPGLSEVRPSNLTLDLGKIEALGFVSRTVKEELDELIQDLKENEA